MLKRTSKQLSMFSSLEDMLSHQHPLFQLSNKINWECFENAFSPLYCSTNGRPAHPIRLMCGLLILKHLRNVSDEMVVSQWRENKTLDQLARIRYILQIEMEKQLSNEAYDEIIEQDVKIWKPPYDCSKEELLLKFKE